MKPKQEPPTEFDRLFAEMKMAEFELVEDPDNPEKQKRYEAAHRATHCYVMKQQMEGLKKFKERRQNQ